MKKWFIIGSGGGLFIAVLVYLFLEAFYTSQFRSVTDPIKVEYSVDLTGLRTLNASGGNQVRFPELAKKLQQVKGRKIIVDGMAEFHGYIQGIPTTFFAYHRKSPNVKHLIRRLIFTGTLQVRPDLVITEENESKKYGFEYEKIYIGSKYTETSENIDKIVDFFSQQSNDTWLHFHCARGKGRTSILLVMLDIFKNAPQVALNDIVERQYLLGSENLFNVELWKKGTYSKQMLAGRKKFIEDFYQFMCQRKAGGIQQWSVWKRQHNKV